MTPLKKQLDQLKHRTKKIRGQAYNAFGCFWLAFFVYFYIMILEGWIFETMYASYPFGKFLEWTGVKEAKNDPQ